MYGEGKKKFEKYVGQFRDGMFHGRGEYYFNDGSKYVYYIIILYNVNDAFFESTYNCVIVLQVHRPVLWRSEGR